MKAPPATLLSVVVPPRHTDELPEMTGSVMTVISCTSLSTVDGVAHVALLVITADITSPVFGMYVNVGPKPIAAPFTINTYAGVLPPFTGLAVKVTEAPMQTVSPGTAVTVTEGVTDGLIPTTAAAAMLSVQPVLLVAVTV